MFKNLIILSLLILSTSSFSKSTDERDTRDIIKSEIDDFYGVNDINAVEGNDPILPTTALYKTGDCIKFNKNNEKFWSIYETMVLTITDIGSKNLKVKQIYFLNDKKWLTGSSNSMRFENQVQFSKATCPPEENMLTEAEIEEMKKDKKLKNLLKNVK